VGDIIPLWWAASFRFGGRHRQESANLVAEQNRIVNRMKATLIRLGIRRFNPKLKKAADRLDDLRTPEGESIPPNKLAELRRDLARRRLRGAFRASLANPA
jgi:transposase